MQGTREVQYENLSLFNNIQEREFIKYINKLINNGLPLLYQIIRIFAEEISEKLFKKI